MIVSLNIHRGKQEACVSDKGMRDGRVVYDFGRFRLDPQRRRLLLLADNTTLALPPRVFDTLLCLIEHRGELLEKAALMDMIWPRADVEENSLNRNISLLRRALGEKPGDHAFIVTAPGSGYRFVAEVSITDAPPDVPSDGGRSTRETLWNFAEIDTRHSVAVLPFANLTGDPASDYICFGIAEELIHGLTGITGLKVPARTSSFAYKDRNADVRLIARELGVKYVLEGSVRTIADKLRITIQLVNGATGYHLWSQSFDRAPSDLLVLRDDIAGSVARAMHVGTPHGPGASSPPTRDVKAYQLLLEAEWLLHTIPSESNVRRAIDLMRQIVNDDPGCARAFALLGDAYSIAHGIRYAIPNALSESERFARSALELDANEWSPHIALAEASRARGQWVAAEASYDVGVRLGRNAPMAFARRSMGLWLNVGYLRRAFDDALQSHLLAPARPETAMFVSLSALASSRDEEARWYVELANELGFPPFFGHMPVIAALIAHRQDSPAQAPAVAFSTEPPVPGAPAVVEKWQLARCVMRGAIDEAYSFARRLLDDGGASGEVGGEWWVLWLPELHTFRRDARFQELTYRLGLDAYWTRHGPPDGHDFRDGRLIVP